MRDILSTCPQNWQAKLLASPFFFFFLQVGYNQYSIFSHKPYKSSHLRLVSDYSRYSSLLIKLLIFSQAWTRKFQPLQLMVLLCPYFIIFSFICYVNLFQEVSDQFDRHNLYNLFSTSSYFTTNFCCVLLLSSHFVIRFTLIKIKF